MLVVLAVALAAVDYLARTVAENAYTETLTRDMREKARVIASAIPAGETDPSSLLRGLAKAANARVTYIAHDGTVIFDSEAAPQKMENHASRPEIRTALEGQDGADARMSASVGIRYEYVAVPVRGGALRLAVPLGVIEDHVTEITRELLGAVVLAFLPAFGVAALLARYVSHRLGSIIGYAGQLARGDFDSHLVLNHRDELGILAEQLNTTGTKLKQTFDELEQEHQKLERVERIRRDFVINVSHELRTPLASIQGYTETLLDGALHDSEHNMRFLQIIRQNAERLGAPDRGPDDALPDRAEAHQVPVCRLRHEPDDAGVRGRAGAARREEGHHPEPRARAGRHRCLLRLRGRAPDPDQPARQRHQVHARGRPH